MRYTASRSSDGERPMLVALVCSAGGLAPLTTVLSGLPANFPAAVIVLQHQPPRKESLLAPILARHCALPLDVARDGATLVGGAVVVIPPGRHALVTVDNRV